MSLRVNTGDISCETDFTRACEQGDRETVEKTAATLWWRLRHPVELNEGLLSACRAGHAPLVKYLLTWSNPRYRNDASLRLAAQHNHIECVKLLLPHVPANTCNSVCAMGALQRGNLELLQLMLPFSFPHLDADQALGHAAKHGHVPLVHWLLKSANPHYKNSVALRLALKEGHTDVVELLLPVSDCLVARQTLMDNQTYDPLNRHYALEHFIQSDLLRDKLNNEVNDVANLNRSKRKM